jgi:polysaccharide export outer membrane protein
MNKLILLTALIMFLILIAYSSDNIVIGKGDLLSIETSNFKEFTFLKYVDNKGKITLPYIGEIKAAGKTPEELSDILEKKLNDGYFVNPKIKISIKKTNKKVYIFGLVRHGGEFSYESDMRLLKLISLAGGFIGDLDSLTVKIFRNNEKVGIFALKKLITENNTNYNILLEPNDVVCIISEKED